VIGIAAIVAWGVFRFTDIDTDASVPALVHTVFIFTCYKFRNHARPFAMALAVLIMAYAWTLPDHVEGARRLYVERNFFGVKKIVDDPDTRLRRLFHGDTIHGVESTGEKGLGRPTSYYHPDGPVGDVMGLVGERRGRQRIGVVGLGSGTMAAYGGPERHVTFYELDPDMPEVANGFFSFLKTCGSNCDIVLGDGRIELARVPDSHFDLLMLDAFSSDSIPAHLLSIEAVELYISKLKPDGILLFHVSNRFLDVPKLVSALASDAGLHAFFRSDESGGLRAEGKSNSDHIVAARARDHLGRLAMHPSWSPVVRTPDFKTWTDDYSNVLGLVRWK
jgi:SAM-dependent methyltransferase